MANPEAVLVAKSLVPRLRRLAKRLASADTRPTSVEFDNGFSYPEALAELLADACKFTVQVAELLDWPVASWKPLMFAVASVEQGLEFPENRRQEFEGLADSFRAYLRGTLRDMIPALSLNTGSLASLDKWEEKLDPATTGFVHSSHEVAFLVPVNDENIEHVNRQLAEDAASACRYMAELLISRLNETTKADANAVAATPETVVLNDTLLRILKVLDGKAMRVEELATTGDESRAKTLNDTLLGIDESTPSAELLHELTPQQGEIVTHLWNAKHATNWQSLPADCWRGGRPTSDQDDRTIESALERLRDKLNSVRCFSLTLEVHSAKQTTKLVRNPPRK